ncbi:MAG: creatininase family protein, partial [Candidatus Poribacteria bacterium]|nr:creatininase family protein [Candidatus Poribacteria bacterium]
MVWRRYVETRPDELAAMVAESPVAFLPLGLIEHHGWHMPVGYDGIKAERLCVRIAERTGGVILPVMWWGANGGHGDFLWTHYQPPQASASVLRTTTEQLLR